MRGTFKFLAVSVFALLIAAPAVMAQTPEYSLLPVSTAINVGGTILQPGTYVIQVLPDRQDRNKLLIRTQDGKQVAQVLSVPHYVLPNEEPNRTTFVFYPEMEGQPRALRTWYAPNATASQGGHDIVYDEKNAAQIARASNSKVVYTAENSTDYRVMTPSATVEPYTPPADTGSMASAAPAPEPEPAPTQVAEAAPVEMPRTASDIPLVALLGLAAVGGAVAFRIGRAS